MAKRTRARRSKPTRTARKSAGARRSGKRPTKNMKAAKGSKRRPRAKAARVARRVVRASKSNGAIAGKTPRLDRARRTLDDIVPTPPSSLDMDRTASAARTGRAELEQSLREHHGMDPRITAGDVDADWENAYFSGDEAPGGDNPTPDQEVVDDIGRAVGVQYEDAEELKSTDKVEQRDKHRWELDPASAEDYKERK